MAAPAQGLARAPSYRLVPRLGHPNRLGSRGDIGLQNGFKIQIDVILIPKSSLLAELIARIGLIQSCEIF